MARAKKSFQCRECGGRTPRWMGRCSDCGAWDSLEPYQEGRSATVGSFSSDPGQSVEAAPITEIDATQAPKTPFGFSEIDRVFGGGLVGGSVTLLCGEPGIGKSTLVLELAARKARQGEKVLYVSGEESAGQVKRRAERVHALDPNLYLMATSQLEEALGAAQRLGAGFVIIDSIQTARLEASEGAAGSVLQVRAGGLEACRFARESGCPVLLIGHVTKEGQLAGPRHLEHIVDCVLSFEGERSREMRWVRGLKNRFGNTEEIALLRMTSEGLEEFDDPISALAMTQGRDLPGTVATSLLEGTRALIVDVQALVATQAWGGGRVRASGLDSSRVSMLAAVLSNRVPGLLPQGDLFASVAGGMRFSDPASDLALVVAMASAARRKAPGEGLAVVGEVGLSGEIRPVSRIEGRHAVVAKHGFQAIMGPKEQPIPKQTGIEWIGVSTVEEALSRLDLARVLDDDPGS